MHEVEALKPGRQAHVPFPRRPSLHKVPFKHVGQCVQLGPKYPGKQVEQFVAGSAPEMQVVHKLEML